MSLIDWVSSRIFNLVHRHNLVYNTCWEDPRLDRQALELGPEDTVLVITSAGCNALDYVLAGAGQVHAVDMNPRQNALLELKIAGLRGLDHPEFFELFGRGYSPAARRLYRERLRESISEAARRYWDRHIGFFENPRLPFFFRGTCGTLARLLNFHIDHVARVRPWIDRLLNSESLEEQRRLYNEHVRSRLWSRSIRFLISRSTTLSMLGVPRAQRNRVEIEHDRDVAGFIRECVDAVFTQIPIHDNYFWRVYLEGRYSPECCPEYLKPAHFARLKAGLIHRLAVHTGTIQDYLEGFTGRISRFVLLDHMDWLSGRRLSLLEAEWQAILDKAAPGARLIWRTGGRHTDFIDPIRVAVRGHRTRLGDLLRYEWGLAQRLHQECRVGTYGAFFIANLSA